MLYLVDILFISTFLNHVLTKRFTTSRYSIKTWFNDFVNNLNNNLDIYSPL